MADKHYYSSCSQVLVALLALLVALMGEASSCPCTISTVPEVDARCNATSQFTFPLCIPSNVTSINFRRNFLVVQPGSTILRRFYNLSRLDLSYNDLHFIPEKFLYYSPKLKELNLEFNHLRTLHPRTFRFSLQLSLLNMFENPWLCDCQLKKALDLLPTHCEVVAAWRTLCHKSVLDYFSIQGLRGSLRCHFDDKDATKGRS